MDRRYALIVGQGRSGTNWLLRNFDFSRETYCRNEPNVCAGSALASLEPWRVGWRQDTPELAESWELAIAATLSHMGEHDAPIPSAKAYLRAPARLLGIQRALRGPRLRPLLGLLMHELRNGEWPVPGWLADPDRLGRSLGILKLVTCPGWAWYVLRHHPEVPVLHIVRHPGGYLNSWSSRYLAPRNVGEVERENLARLDLLRSQDPERVAALAIGEGTDVDGTELAYWRYANELVFEAGRGAHGYHYISYEMLASDPVAIMQRLYEACGLVWTPEVEAQVRTGGRNSREISTAWRNRLTPPQLTLVDRVVRETPLPLGNGA